MKKFDEFINENRVDEANVYVPDWEDHVKDKIRGIDDFQIDHLASAEEALEDVDLNDFESIAKALKFYPNVKEIVSIYSDSLPEEAVLKVQAIDNKLKKLGDIISDMKELHTIITDDEIE